MNIIKYLFRQSWVLLSLATVAGMVSGFSGAGLAKVISEGMQGGGNIHERAWTFFGLCLMFLVSRTFSETSLIRLTQDAISHLRMDLSRKVLATPLKKLQALGKAELLAILTGDINTFIQAFQLIPVTFGNFILIVTCSAYLAWLSWQLFAVFALFLFGGITAYHFAEKAPLRMLATLREHSSTLYEGFRNLIEGSKELQLNASRGRNFLDHVLAPTVMSYRRTSIRAMSDYVWVGNTGGILFYVTIGVMLFVIPLWMPQSGATLTTFTLVLMFMMRPIGDIMASLPVLRQAGISLVKIQQLEGDLVTGVLPSSNDEFAGRMPLKLELRGICHQYPGLTEDSPFMLGPLDLVVEQGEIIFIVGGNGSGKTTLALLLLGMYEQEAGEIVLNGVSVNDNNRDNYRAYFSAVFSDFHLFEQLLTAENEDTGLRVAHYLEMLGVAHKVKVKDGNFSTIDLSTGQRKRLALIASYLEDRPVYLFDEWAADQDPVFKRVFYTELLPELKARGKTVLVISHDDGYFEYADRIVKLADGRLQSDTAVVSELLCSVLEINS